jgi:hypothetical protein
MNFAFDIDLNNHINMIKNIRQAAENNGFSIGLKEAKDMADMVKKAYLSNNLIASCKAMFLETGSRFFQPDTFKADRADYDFFAEESPSNFKWLGDKGFAAIYANPNYQDRYLSAVYRRSYENTHIDVQIYPASYFSAKRKANAMIKNLCLYDRVDKNTQSKSAISNFWDMLIASYL